MNARWIYTVVGDLHTIRAGLLDLIECEPADRTWPRRPSEDERTQTLRGADRDQDYARPVPPKGTRSEPGDPVRRQVERREQTVAYAVQQLHGIIDAVNAVTVLSLTMFGQHVPGPDGDELLPPAPLPTRVLPSGHPQPQLSIGQAARHVIACVDWAEAACVALANWWATRPEGADALLDQRLEQLAHDISRASRGYGRDIGVARRRRCANPHGLTAHIGHGEQVDGVCRACRAPVCADPLRRDCGRRISGRDLDEGRSTCGACRKAAARQSA